MAAYFKDICSNVVLKFDLEYDIKQLREQIGDYVEVPETEYNAYKGIEPKQVKTK